MYWELYKQKKQCCGQDNFIISINDGEMKFSCFEILESLPRDYIRQFLDYLDQDEQHVDPKERYKE